MRLRCSKLVFVVLAVMLAAAPLLASMHHPHAGGSDNNCPVCHFNHQPMDRPLAGHRLPSFETVHDSPVLMEARVVAAKVVPPLPSRAPPSA